MNNMYYVSDTGIVKPCFGVREIVAENFNPMIVNSTYWDDFKSHYIQVEIDFLGEKAWINVLKSKITCD